VWFAPTLVVYQDVVLFTESNQAARHGNAGGHLTALSADTGEVLWSCEQQSGGYNTAQDVLVAGGLVWGTAAGQEHGSEDYVGRDPRSGEVRQRFSPGCSQQMPHPRCYRAKATENYLVESRTGIELVDVRAGQATASYWLRGACLYGVMPCNGLLYAPPHDCVCYAESQLSGFRAFAPATEEGQRAKGEGRSEGQRAKEEGQRAGSDPRLERGPAYEEFRPSPFALCPSSDWPTYRHDAARSGATPCRIPPDLKQVWQAELGGRLTAPVIAEGRVFVASVDAHTVHAVAADSGQRLWDYTAGGRIDSPPTLHQGRVLF
jgi:hypothetical protein